MKKDIVGDWGAGLGDDDYACALAALGALEATSTTHHQASDDPAEVALSIGRELGRAEVAATWRGARAVGPSTTAAGWRDTSHENAGVLAAAWRRYLTGVAQPRWAPRLAIEAGWSRRPDLVDLDALHGWLSRPAVRLGSLIVTPSSDRRHRSRPPWHWPVRFGALDAPPGSPLHLAWASAASRQAWFGELSTFAPVGTARDRCDVLLLLPGEGATLAGRPSRRLRASLVICLDDPPPGPSQLTPAHAGLLELLGAAGVALVGGGPMTRLGDWLEGLVAELSHDVPADAAVGRMAAASGQPALVYGVPASLDRCRIVAIADRLDEELLDLDPEAWVSSPPGGSSGATPPAPPGQGGATPPAGAGASFETGASERAGSHPRRGVAPPPPPPAPVVLGEAVRSRAFQSEGVDGIASKAELQDHAGRVEERRQRRFVQASAWRGGEDGEPARSLAPGVPGLLAVHLGPSARPRDDAAFPEDRLDFTRGAVELNVQIELVGAAVEAVPADLLAGHLGSTTVEPRSLAPASHRIRALLEQRALTGASAGGPAVGVVTSLATTAIRLPPVGDSSAGLFFVTPQGGAARVEGRIAVIHGNRILQTARLAVAVAASPGEGKGVRIAAAPSVHPRLDDLEERRDYDVAIGVSELGGHLHLAVQRGGEVTQVRLDDLVEPIDRLRRVLQQSALKWDYSKPVAQPRALGELLVGLAANGSLLEQHLRKRCGDDIDRWERIHLVPSTHRFLPLEYVYAGPPPDLGAELCRNALSLAPAALCHPSSASPRCPNATSRAFVCPLHFWGFSRLVERNGVVEEDGDGATSPDGHAEVAVPSKQRFGEVRTAVYAASDRAFAFVPPAQVAAERSALLRRLGELFPGLAAPADWAQWRKAVAERPHLLLLIAHTDEVTGVPVLEIGARSLLGKHQILPEVSGAGGEPQLLVLLGCSAAEVTEDFQPYPERFRDAGTSIVLAPVAPIRGADAVPIARRLAELLKDRLAAPEPTAFGELLPMLRRELLRDGHPGVLGLVGFGDGDWLMGGA